MAEETQVVVKTPSKSLRVLIVFVLIGCLISLQWHKFAGSMDSIGAWSTSMGTVYKPAATGSDKPAGQGYTWNEKGCQAWPKHTTQEPFLDPKTPPTGIAVSLAFYRQRTPAFVDLTCQKLPTQFSYFLQPQNLDMLLLWDVEGQPLQQIITCLELVPVRHEFEQNWTNADGTFLTTHHYTTKTGKTNVFVGDYRMSYPNYIQKNMTILEEPMWDCATPVDYVQGTRFYTDQYLHLQLVERYEYFVKMDLDIEFASPMPFNMLWDMKQRGSIFGHTGEFPKGLCACCKGIKPVMKSFAQEYANTTATDWSPHWKGPCSAGVNAFERGCDQWYTNLVVMRTDFFYSEPVRAYGRWMSEYQPGWFKYRWGDQLFFHIAMGMFLGPDFRDYVADYTDLRCRRYPNCWFFWAGGQHWNAENRCHGGGIFYHGKTRKQFGDFTGKNYSNVTAPLLGALYQNQYRHDCDHLPRDKWTEDKKK